MKEYNNSIYNRTFSMDWYIRDHGNENKIDKFERYSDKYTIDEIKLRLDYHLRDEIEVKMKKSKIIINLHNSKQKLNLTIKQYKGGYKISGHDSFHGDILRTVVDSTALFYYIGSLDL